MPWHVRSMEESGGSFIAATFWTGRKVPPSGEHEQAKDRVDKAEHPGRRVVVQELLQPVLNEPATVCLCAGLRAQPHFKCCERARDTKPCFCHNSGDGNEMRQPEPEAIDPTPALEISKDDKNQASHDKSRNGDVQDEHGVGKELALRLVEQRSCHINVRHQRQPQAGGLLDDIRSMGLVARCFMALRADNWLHAHSLKPSVVVPFGAATMGVVVNGELFVDVDVSNRNEAQFLDARICLVAHV